MTVKKYTVILTEEGGSSHLERFNDGFETLELLGLTALLQQDIIDQMRGKVQPDKISRKVVEDQK